MSKELEELLAKAKEFKSGIEKTLSDLNVAGDKIRPEIEKIQQADQVKESRCIAGAMISIMESGDVRIKFDSPERTKEFYDSFK